VKIPLLEDGVKWRNAQISANKKMSGEKKKELGR
jgi:hypothetical protein